MFKDKTSKKRFQNVDITRDLSTLDAMHNKIINNYSKKIIDDKNYIERINNLEINYKNINDDILKYNIDNLKIDNIYSNLWNSNILIKEELKLLHNEINNINYFDEIEYYENTSSILFNYYEMLEKQSSTNSISSSNNNKYKNKSILESFNITLPKEEIKIEEDDKIVEKSDLVDQYLSITNKYYIKRMDNNNDNTEICHRCNIPLICLQHDAIMICNNCGYQELLLVEQNRPILKQNTKDTSHFSYKRINHFREWCNQVQGKESTDIPNDIFEKILNEIKKEKIMDTKRIP